MKGDRRRILEEWNFIYEDICHQMRQRKENPGGREFYIVHI
jgi:hypothetical protein